jgi:PIF1-like helicase
VKAAYTGVAAALIGGKTTHSLAGIATRMGSKMSEAMKSKLQSYWKSKRYLIIDEFSMISKSFLATLSRNISIAKQGTQFDLQNPFGGMSVILCGDLHQFPPVAKNRREFLYTPINPATDSFDCKMGRAIYEHFETVVILKEQMRIKDPIWQSMLTNLRKGQIQDSDIKMLRDLVIPTADKEDFNSEPWSSAPLVTPRHAVRTMWNEHCTRKHCKSSGQPVFVCYAEDTIRGKPLTVQEQFYVALHDKESKNQKGQLPRKVEIAKGMKILVTNNIATDLDITNGAQGEIVDIILHPEEPPISNNSIIHLVKMPLYILVKLTRTRASQLEGLDEYVVPIEALTCRMDISMPISDQINRRRSVLRRQFPITGAYAFTDYRSQGQTLSHVIVDPASPPSGGLSLFNLYVALSRSLGRCTIRLLRDFDDKVFQKAFDTDLTLEDERLEQLDRLFNVQSFENKS